MNFKKIWSKLYNWLRLLKKHRHKNKIKSAKRIHKKLITISKENNNYFPIILNYLRKIDPYVFEELILSILEKENYIIKRNLFYSGDGGSDGVFYINNKKIIIQCKRYTGFIKNKDIELFQKTIKNEKAFTGIFFHTGKTNNRTKVSAYNKGIFIISGNKLLDFILNKQKLLDLIKC